MQTQPRKLKSIPTAEKVIGANIAARRGTLGLSQVELGEAIGRDRRFIQRIEYGETGVCLSVLPELQLALRLDDVFVLLKPDAFI